ncbi:unnamed protein product [Ectocarpus sp. CCAP 1310/34]|nr:unnamed protein product [Ectocarpus sp. CCAP 1310/34]
MVLDQIPLTMPAPIGEAPPVIQQRDGRGDEAATIAARQDLVRRNRLRREVNNSLRGSHELNQQRRTKRNQNPYAPASSRNHHDQQGLEQEHQKVKRRAEGLPGEELEVSLEPETPEDAESSLPTIYRTSNGSCPVIPHNSNSAVLQKDQDNAASSTTIVGGLSVWARLQQAATASSRLQCPSPRCCQGWVLNRETIQRWTGAAASAAAATSAAQQQQQPDAPAPPGASDEVQVVDTAVDPSRVSVKEAERLLKLKKVQTGVRKSKPSGASAYAWRYFEGYVKGNFKAFAVCKLCMEQKEFGREKIKYSQSPSNMLSHLHTDFAGHQAAFEDCTSSRTAAGRSLPVSAAGAASGAISGPKASAGIDSYFIKDTAG